VPTIRARPVHLVLLSLLAVVAVVAGLTMAQADPPNHSLDTTTPIKHLIVIYGENQSFDHYYGTYPNATNPAGQPAFHAAGGTPSVNGLTEELLTHNPNTANPRRLDRSQAVTCDQGHGYGSEQKAFNGGAMDKFVQYTAGGSCTDKSIVMGYYDGNTVTALWNLAQHFALSDNSFGTGFGPSTPGAINLISGNTHGATPANGNGVTNGTMLSDPNPAGDVCGSGTATMTGRNVGNLLNDQGVTWGWFQGGFKPTSTTPKTSCLTFHSNVAGGPSPDYVPHHEPFQYYPSTANPQHLPPTSTAKIGQTDQANHQYDLTNFDASLKANSLPAVSFLKAASFEDAHPGTSDPIDEGRFVARVVNAVEASPAWDSTAIVIAYDDSDGWYDHVYTPPTRPSATADDALTGPGQCGTAPDATYAGRCGPGPRLPLTIISPWARTNYVDHTQTEQASILRFIEDNWSLGRIGDSSADATAGSLDGMFDFDPSHARAPKVYLSPVDGTIASGPSGAPTAPPGKTTTTGSHVTTTTTTVKPPPPPPPLKVKLSCSVKRSSRSLRVTCTTKTKLTGKTTFAYRLLRGRSTVAKSKTLKLSKGRVATTIKVRHKPKAGRYTLKVTVKNGGRTATATKTVKVR
jgi:phospholipase C